MDNESLNWLIRLTVGGLVGMLGQSIRVIVGISKVNDQAQKTGARLGDLFDGTQLAVSLLIGFVAGAIGSVGIAESDWASAKPIYTLLGIGYAGTDFIEGFMKKFLPDAATGSPAAVVAPADGARVPPVG